MKSPILIGATIAAALAASLGAQVPQPSGAASPAQPPGSQVTMTGCLKAGDAGTSTVGGGATGGSTAGSSASGSGFILTGATSAAGTGGAPKAGAPAADASASATSYRLQGGDQSNLRKYVNSRVEVRGTLSKSATPAAGTLGPTGAAGATGSGATATRESGVSSNLPTLQVASVRQVASSCAP